MTLLNSFNFELPTKIEYGAGAAQKLTAAIRELNALSVLIVTDKGFEACELLSEITGRLAKDRVQFEIFSDVESNPTDYNVHQGARLAKQLPADCLVAIGGGALHRRSAGWQI